MLLPAEIKSEAESILSSRYENSIKITRFETVSGGSINHALKIFTNEKAYFLKWNYVKKYPLMFETEAKGLELLRKPKSIAIPEVIGTKEIDLYSFLILEFVESAGRATDFFERLGKQLAVLHKNTSQHFGLDHDNYIGSLPQSNKQSSNWTEFYILQRLEPQLEMARNKNLMDKQANKQFNKMFNVLHEIFPSEKPALLHGDLWSGNYLAGNEGEPLFIDPAVYYGHREMDIAMSRLFGGFGEEFYSTYNNEWPMEKGWEKRMDICNLYPLLVHVNLFSTGYVRQVLQIIKQF